MEFVIHTERRDKLIIAQFVSESCYEEINKELGDIWLNFTKEPFFLQIIREALIEHLEVCIAPELEDADVEIRFSKSEPNVLIVYADDFPWCELEITRYGFCVRGEPVEDIHVYDVNTDEVAW
ncbi:hypothetical protein [Drosophila suzukii associated hytrosavirus 1]|nr:hypothetical protein [Drosophila suzukii associated hytrosavirus 1]